MGAAAETEELLFHQHHVGLRAGLAAESDALSHQHDLTALVIEGDHNIVV